MLVGRFCTGRVALLCCVLGYGGRRVWRIMVWPTRLTPFPFRPMHAWLVWSWSARVWSVYGQVAAAAVVWLVHGGLGGSMVSLASVGSVALLPDVVCVAGSPVPALVSGVLVRLIAVQCSVVMLVGWLRIGRVRCAVVLVAVVIGGRGASRCDRCGRFVWVPRVFRRPGRLLRAAWHLVLTPL